MDNAASFSAELSSLYPMLEWVRERLEAVELSDVEVRRIEIALEEGLVNIISYAYQREVGTIELEFHYVEEDYVELIIRDSGLPFNPLKHRREVDPLTPIEELEVGGLGILFIQKLMDKVEYNRLNEKNTLILKKKLPKKAP